MTGCPSPCTGCSTTCPNLAAVLAAQVRDDAPPRGLPRPADRRRVPIDRDPVADLVGSERSLVRGQHPATNCRVDETAGTCSGCRFWDRGPFASPASTPGTCRLARVRCLGSWPACTAAEPIPAADRPVPGTSSPTAPSTSRRAAGQCKAGSQKARALLVLAGGPETAHAVAAEIGVNPNQTAARLLELHRDGLVTFAMSGGAPLEAETTPGCWGRLHALTVAGKTEAERLRSLSS